MIYRSIAFCALWPMIIILNVGILGTILWTLRTLFTRDDIRHDLNFLTFNQKYEIPPGLMKAYLAVDDEEEQEE
uniref:Uncharacterized protein n=1 Tax=Glossina pallidipes TaxID=7398 RepID=A0A1A9ZAB5_GLOPL